VEGRRNVVGFLPPKWPSQRHEIVRRATIVDGAVEFEANEEFVVIVRVPISYICMHCNIVVAEIG
jgi:hypothetical protein